jgi:hypothetical protein
MLTKRKTHIFTKTLAVAIALTFLITTGCSKKQEAKKSSETAAQKMEGHSCAYSYSDSSSTFKWTAYKYTKKVGVSGSFKEIRAKINDQQTHTSAKSLLTGMSFAAATQSVESGLPLRDTRIAKNFFGILTNTKEIQATIKSLDGNTGILEITMNNVTKDIPLTYKKTRKDSVTITATVDVNDFQGQKAIASLQEVCKGGHTGEDGKTVLWPDVDIIWTTVLEKKCI